MTIAVHFVDVTHDAVTLAGPCDELLAVGLEYAAHYADKARDSCGQPSNAEGARLAAWCASEIRSGRDPRRLLTSANDTTETA